MPRRQQGVVIADIELPPIVIPIAVCAVSGDEVVYISAIDYTEALSRANRHRPKRGMPSASLKKFPEWATRYRLNIVISHSRTYRGATADALATNSADLIEGRSAEQFFSRVGIPEVWTSFGAFPTPGSWGRDIAPVCFVPRRDLGCAMPNGILPDTMPVIQRRGLAEFEACARHS